MSTPSPADLPPDIILSGSYEAGIIVLTIVSVGIVWLRMYTRLYITHNSSWDDWLMFVASLIAIVDNAFLITSYHYGLGRHIYYLSPDQITNTFMWLWAGEPTNLFAVYLVRVSISLFFLRLVPAHKKIYVRLIWGVIIGMTIADVYVSVNYFAECRPIQKVWMPDVAGTCFSPEVLAAGPWFYQAVSIIGDVIILAIPICLFRDLNVGRKAKFALIGVLCLGVFTCVCAIVKTVLLPNLFAANPDKSWTLAQLVLWASLEMCIGMICGSIPSLRPLFTALSERTSKLSRNSKFISNSSGSRSRSSRKSGTVVGITSFHSSRMGRGSKMGGVGGFAGVGRSSEYTTSQEEFIAMREPGAIRATTEVDVRTEGSGGEGGKDEERREGRGEGWDAV